MSSESKEDDVKSRPPKNRGEVYAQEQQRIAEETNKLDSASASILRIYSRPYATLGLNHFTLRKRIAYTSVLHPIEPVVISLLC